MEGRTNILPIVGGYVDAPVENFVAGETIRRGNFVQKVHVGQLDAFMEEYSEMAKRTQKAHKLFDGKVAYYGVSSSSSSDGTVSVDIFDVGVDSFVKTRKNLFNFGFSGAVLICIPLSDTSVFIYAKENSLQTPREISKVFTYDGTDFTGVDVTVTGTLTVVPSSTALCEYFGGGTLAVIGSNVYYVTYSNGTVSIVQGSSTVTSGSVKILSYQNFAIVFVYSSGYVSSYYIVTYSNSTLTVSTANTVDGSCFGKIGSGFVGLKATNEGYELAHYSVDGVGNISKDATYQNSLITNISLCDVVCDGSNILLCLLGMTASGSGSSRTYTYYPHFHSLVYSSGFVESDIADWVDTFYRTGSALVAFVCEKIDSGLFCYCFKSSTASGNSELLFQGVNGSIFEYGGQTKVVKASSRFDGVAKTSGNTGDTIEVYVPVSSS